MRLQTVKIANQNGGKFFLQSLKKSRFIYISVGLSIG